MLPQKKYEKSRLNTRCKPGEKGEQNTRIRCCCGICASAAARPPLYCFINVTLQSTLYFLISTPATSSGEGDGWRAWDAQRRSCVALSPPQLLAATAKCHQPCKNEEPIDKQAAQSASGARRRRTGMKSVEARCVAIGSFRGCIYPL